MTAGQEQPMSLDRLFRIGRAYWLPPRGHGDGLEALSWAQLARLPSEDAERLLAALAVAAVPAWVAPVRPAGRTAADDVWVATIDIDRAEDIAITVLNERPPAPARPA